MLPGGGNDGVPASVVSDECAAMRQIADRVGDRWSLIVIAALAHGPRGYNQLERDLDGISRRMLSFTLRNLERDGLITRTPLPTRPPRTIYALSSLGKALNQAARPLLDWARANRRQLDQARASFDTRSA